VKPVFFEKVLVKDTSFIGGEALVQVLVSESWSWDFDMGKRRQITEMTASYL